MKGKAHYRPECYYPWWRWSKSNTDQSHSFIQYTQYHGDGRTRLAARCLTVITDWFVSFEPRILYECISGVILPPGHGGWGNGDEFVPKSIRLKSMNHKWEDDSMEGRNSIACIIRHPAILGMAYHRIRSRPNPVRARWPTLSWYLWETFFPESIRLKWKIPQGRRKGAVSALGMYQSKPIWQLKCKNQGMTDIWVWEQDVVFNYCSTTQ